jgi:tetratricopeptide (TPR) repeat protein
MVRRTCWTQGFALELCARMERWQAWRCVWVKEGAEGEVVGRQRAAAPRARLLLVVDYAEARPPERLEVLLEAAVRDERVRVLLLARHAGDWWQWRLGGGTWAVRNVVTAASLDVLPLEDDPESAQTAEETVRRAVPFFATKLGVPVPDAGLVTVSAEGRPRVLDLHAAALVAVLKSRELPAGSQVAVNTGMILKSLLAHELHYWQGRANAVELMTGPDGLSIEQLSQVAAVGCLLGMSGARELSERVPRVTITEAVARWLQDLYPATGDGELGVLRPDRLAEMHVSRELGNSPELANACLTGLDAAQAQRALVLLARASADHEQAQALLKSSLARFPEVVAGLAAPRQVMIAIADAIPYPSAALAEAHASIALRILGTYPRGTAGWAQWLNTRAVLLGDLGRREEALTAIEDAVTAYRMLAHYRPGIFRRDLAMALNNQSLRLSALGRQEEALQVINEAVTYYRPLADVRPDIFRRDLAMALNNQSLRLSALGWREEAMRAIDEAVRIYRALASDRPDTFLPDLAMALNNQSSCLSDLGRGAEALAVIEEAVAIRRALADVRPDIFLAGLASALNSRSVHLSALGRRAEAMLPIDEAGVSFRALAEELPGTFLPGLAMALNNQSSCLSDLGRAAEALVAIEEAVAVYNDLAGSRPEVFLAALAMALNNQSSCLSDLGRGAEALEVIEEAVAIRRSLAGTRPQAFLPDLARSLSNKSLRLSDLGRGEEALRSIDEAVANFRALAGELPGAFLPDLATALANKSWCLSDLGRSQQALAVIEEAADVHRGLADARPAVFAGRYANSLETKAMILSLLGRDIEAQAVRQEATAIRESTDPGE